MATAACMSDEKAGPSGWSLKLSTTNKKAGNAVVSGGLGVAVRSGKHKLESFVTTTEQCDPEAERDIDRGNQAARNWQTGAEDVEDVTAGSVQRARRIDRGKRALDPFHTTWRSSSWRLRSVLISSSRRAFGRSLQGGRAQAPAPASWVVWFNLRHCCPCPVRS